MSKKVQISLVTRPLNNLSVAWFYFFAREIVKDLLQIKRGPDAVLDSLKRGLSDTGVSYNVNPSKSKLADTVHVLSNPLALSQMIELKKTGYIKKLVCGPNVSILPTFDDAVMCNDSIDTILLPSDWTREAFTIDCSKISEKIKIWPAGVKVPEANNKESKTFLVFKKDYPDLDYDKIIKALQSNNIDYKEIGYGNYGQKEYYDLLENSQAMVYLQKSESQGLALQEAWIRDVPTLVWNSKSYTYKNKNITVIGKIGAPYLSDESGMFFESAEDFDNKLKQFISRTDSFTPRKYCTENLSDKASVKIYLESI